MSDSESSGYDQELSDSESSGSEEDLDQELSLLIANAPPKSVLLIENAPPKVDSDAILDLFAGEEHAALAAHVFKDDRKLPLNRVFMFFENEEQARSALTEMKGVKLGDTPMMMMLSPRNPLLKERKESRMFFKNLDANTTRDQLKAGLTEYGNVVSVKLDLDDGGMCTGSAYVVMHNSVSATAAIAALHGHTLPPGTNTLYVSKRNRKGTA